MDTPRQGRRFARESGMVADRDVATLIADDGFGSGLLAPAQPLELNDALFALQARLRSETQAARGRRSASVAIAPARWQTKLIPVAIVVAAIGGSLALLGGGSATKSKPAVKVAPKAHVTIPTAAQLASAAAGLAASAQPGQEIGRVLVPAIAYEHGIVQGAALGYLAHNAGHYASGALPGQPGTVGIAARTVSGGPPYGALAKVAGGEQIVLRMPYGTFTYHVDSVRQVAFADTSALRGATGSRVALTAVSGGRRLVIAGTLRSTTAATPATVGTP
jgi:LPXTG-site transpeptidase (sortase) family protein